ncbi:MAG TPA: cytochrome c oxidase accessory protein CcoG [Gemmatimonadales bacterium]|nr:cytochrome c oxidase accessory protein CcoG [Gemmatimonadales bacterium]
MFAVPPAPPAPPTAKQRVLSTLNVDGSRRWLRPKLSTGAFWRRRRVVAYGLMLVFFLIPYIRMNGRPLVLLDIPRREFTIFGYTFLPTDTLLFMLLLMSIAIAIFLLTALVGRAWCGWACPQTVYMEFLFRPIERLFEGGASGSARMDKAGTFHARRLAKHAVYLVLALFLAHTFLAYFVGIDQLVHWVQRSPVEHPTSFLIMAGTTAAIFLDFAWFREQTCIVACPYGRLQSVLLDRQSLIVGYDPRRGEPRSLKVKGRAADAGDCIDCGACVQTCPTGIDIRDGLQMECIHCTQCADACDAIMDRVGKPRGLIRYSSRDALEGRGVHLLRPRVILYPLALALALGLLGFNLGTKAVADVTLLRGIGAPFTREPGGRVVNQVRVRIANRGHADREYRLELVDAGGVTLVAPQNPLPVAAGKMEQTSIFVMVPPGEFDDGELEVTFRVSDGKGFVEELPYELVGPEESEHEAGPGSPGRDS